jgi:hypothetical protein
MEVIKKLKIELSYDPACINQHTIEIAACPCLLQDYS